MELSNKMDYTKLKNNWEGDDASFSEIITKMVERFESDLTLLHDALAKKDTDKVKFLAHKFKFVSKYLYANTLLDNINAVETAHKEGNTAKSLELGLKMAPKIREITAVLKSKIGN
jgi:HPt (histidine-containing phosphotransfer) domain-containing protein